MILEFLGRFSRPLELSHVIPEGKRFRVQGFRGSRGLGFRGLGLEQEWLQPSDVLNIEII